MPTAIELAPKLALAMARAPLPPEARQVLSLQVAWPLAFLLAEWRLGRDLAAAGLAQIALAFSFFRGQLERFIGKAETAQDAAALAGAGSLFHSAVQEIGMDRLRQALSSPVFREAVAAINGRVPPPREVAEAFAGSPSPAAQPAPTSSRVRRYEASDYRNAAPTPTPAESAEVAFYRRELNRADIQPDLRWFYETQLASFGLRPYLRAEDARVVWTEMLKNPLHADLRAYFTEQLRSLNGGGSLKA